MLHHLCHELDLLLPSLKSSLLFLTKFAEAPGNGPETRANSLVWWVRPIPWHKNEDAPILTPRADYLKWPYCQMSQGRGEARQLYAPESPETRNTAPNKADETFTGAEMKWFPTRLSKSQCPVTGEVFFWTIHVVLGVNDYLLAPLFIYLYFRTMHINQRSRKASMFVSLSSRSLLPLCITAHPSPLCSVNGKQLTSERWLTYSALEATNQISAILQLPFTLPIDSQD